MRKKISEMNVKNWVEVVGVFLILCGFICFVIGIGVNSLKTATEVKNFTALISFWKTGLLFEMAGIIILILSGIFPSNEQK